MADAAHRNAPERVRGNPPFAAAYLHPRWEDGPPILVGEDVETPDGWHGFVSSVTCEEVTVTAYSDGFDDHYEEFSPDDLTRVPARPEVVRGS